MMIFVLDFWTCNYGEESISAGIDIAHTSSYILDSSAISYIMYDLLTCVQNVTTGPFHWAYSSVCYYVMTYVLSYVSPFLIEF